MFLFGIKKNQTFVLHISVWKFLFQRRSKILFDGGWIRERLDNLHFFVLIEFFRYSTIFQHFDTSIYSIKMMKFPR